MVEVEIRHENGDGKESGYGVYVNGYIRDEMFDPPEVGGIYASECVPFGKNTPETLAAAEKRVRRTAMDRYRRDLMQV